LVSRTKFKKMNYSTLYQGKVITYSLSGEGPALVFLHGYLETKAVWEAYTKHFESTHQVLTIDLPGHGGSEVLRTVHSMKDLAMVVKFLMDKHSMGQTVVVGHSMGGYVALAFVDHYPEKVRGLVMFSSTAMNDNTDRILARNREISLIRSGKKDQVVNHNIPNLFAAQNLAEFSHQVEAIKVEAKKMTDIAMIAALEGMKTRVNNVNMMKHLPYSVLFIAGKHDNLIPLENSLRQVENAPRIILKVLENSGHMGYIEEETVSAQYVLDYLKKLP